MKEIQISPENYRRFKANCALDGIKMQDAVVAAIQRGMRAGDPGPLRTRDPGRKTWACKVSDEFAASLKAFCAEHRVHPCVAASKFIDDTLADGRTIYTTRP